MAFSNRGANLPGVVAAADLTAAQHRFVTIDSNGKAGLTGAAGRIDAVVENNPNTDEPASLMGPGSVAKVEASAAIALGANVSSAANGQARTAVQFDFIAGVCVEAAGASGDLCSVWMTHPGTVL